MLKNLEFFQIFDEISRKNFFGKEKIVFLELLSLLQGFLTRDAASARFFRIFLRPMQVYLPSLYIHKKIKKIRKF